MLTSVLLLSSGVVPSLAVDGRAIYQRNCQGCHGQNARGGRGPTLAGKAAVWPFATFRNAVLNGIGNRGQTLSRAMPRWGRMGFAGARGQVPSDATLKALQAYLRSVK